MTLVNVSRFEDLFQACGLHFIPAEFTVLQRAGIRQNFRIGLAAPKAAHAIFVTCTRHMLS